MTGSHTHTDPAVPAPPAGAAGDYRAAAGRFRPPRTLPATLTAAAVATGSLLGAAEITSRLLHRPAEILPIEQLTQLGRDTRWDDPLTIAAAAAATMLGLLLILLGAWPGRARAIPLASPHPDTVVGITPTGLRRHATHAAETVDGITHAKTTTTASRRRIQVRATSPLRDAGDLHHQVHTAVTRRIQQLAPLRHPTVRVTIRHREE